MNQQICCPKCGSDDLAYFNKRNEYRCDCGHNFAPHISKSVKPMRIFLSYGHDRNEELVLRIKADLEVLGHDVWLDREEIKFADDWRHKITGGIRASDWMFSFLSKYSTRDPGVCLDELGIALGVKGGIVHSILVESETDVSPPPSISHLQWLDMHDWHERQQGDPEEYAAWYSEKLTEICRVLESETNQRFAGEIELLQKKLKPVTMDAFTASLLEKGFSGRQWLVDELNDWLGQERTSRAFVLTGEPGIGKSAFAAWLAHFNKAEVLAAVFMRYNQPQSCDPNRVICSLAFQLACRLPDYRKHLIHLAEIDKLDEKNQSELFSYLLTEPLHLCIDGNRSNGVILVDALDEAPTGSAGVAELLARHAQELPAWLKIVATTRPEPRLLSVLAALYPRKLDADDLRNRQDITDYLKEQLSDFNPDGKTVDAIVDKSEGIFLYAEHVVAQVLLKGLSLDRVDEFPEGLPGIYTQYFQRQFPDIENYHATTGLALQVLLAAQEPLGRDDLAMVLGWNETMIHRQLLALGSLFPEAGGKIQPFHRSLGEWLTSYEKAGEYFVSLRDGHCLLATVGWARLERLLAEEVVDPLLDYAALYAGLHLYAGGQENSLETLIQRVVASMNSGISGYGEILGKLIDWVAKREDFSDETLFKKMLDTVTDYGCSQWLVLSLRSRARQLEKGGSGKWATFLYEIILRISVDLNKINTVNFGLRRDLSISFNNVGDSLEKNGDFDGALEMYLESLAIREMLATKVSEPELSDLHYGLFVSYNKVGGIYEAQGDRDKALKNYKMGLSICKKLVAQEPENIDFKYGLSISYNKVGGCLWTQGNDVFAMDMFLKTLAIREDLVAKKPENTYLNHGLSIAYNNVGILKKVQGKEAYALELFLKALNINKMLVLKEPVNTDFRRELSVTHNNVGNLYFELGAVSYAFSLNIGEELVEKEPDRSDLRRELSITYKQFGSLYHLQGKSTSALELYLKAIAIGKGLLNKNPSRTDLLWFLYDSYNKTSNLYETQGDGLRAQKMRQMGLEILESLKSSQIFISYSSKDKKIADTVCHYLEAKSIRCWMAPRDIPQGSEWGDVIVDAISTSRAVVLIFSASANDSPIVKREILHAVNKEIRIIPFRVENTLPAKALELFIEESSFVDAFLPPTENGLNRLVQRVEDIISESAERLLYEPDAFIAKYEPIQEIESLKGET